MSWYKIENKADKAEVWIYEQIGEDFWTGGGVTAKKFQKELSEIKASQIDLHINSPGGSVQDGIGIYNQIKQHPANVTTYIDGWACSIASIIALAGDQVIMAENGVFMVHNPVGCIQGYAKDMRNVADILDKIGGTMISTYSRKTKKSEDEIRLLLDGQTGEGTWMNAAEAKEAGFIDGIAEEIDLAACAKFLPVMSKAGFKHIPDEIKATREVLTAKDAEKGLRAAGFSHKQAKVIVAEGYKGHQRDVDTPPAPRDVVPAISAKKDRVADLLTRAEVAAPQTNKDTKEK